MIRTMRALSVALALAGATACTTSKLPPLKLGTPLAAPGPVDRPTLAVGDRWSYTVTSGGRIEDTYAGQRHGALVFQRVNQARAGVTRYDRLMTADLALISGGGTANRPDDGVLRFPLEVGKAWQHRYVRVLQRPTPQEAEVVVEAEVKSYERLTLPGGTFDAFRVESISKTFRANVPPVHATYWYAPSVKAIVKYRAEYRASSPGITVEAMIGFELSDHELRP